MKDILPTNRKFGLFFGFLFFVFSVYSISNENFLTSYVAFSIGCLLIFLAFFFSKLLSPFNLAWFNLGKLLGKIVSPIVLGIIFFLMITPIGLLMKVFKRDELRLKLTDKSTNWKIKTELLNADSFKNQF